MIDFCVPPVDRAEVLRRAALKAPSDTEKAAMEAAVSLLGNAFIYDVSEYPRPLSVLEGNAFLKGQLAGADVLIVFRASLGKNALPLLFEMDEDEPERGIFARALIAERLDALCEAYCDAKAARLTDGGFLTSHYPYAEEGFPPDDAVSLTRVMGICATPREHTAARCRSCFIASCSFRKNG